MKSYKMNLGMVDVILPIYKPNHFVFEAINSVINQTYKNWILHIVDDASGDNYLEKIKQKYGFLNSKIKYYQLEKNRRQAFARNYAISKGYGEYIAFIDQDDVWVKEKLEKQIEIIKHDKSFACHTNLSFIDITNKTIRQHHADNENNFRNNIIWNAISPISLTKIMYAGTHIRLVSSMVSRKAFIDVGGFDDSLFGGEDWEFWIRFSNKYKISHLSDILINRRMSDLNTSDVHKYDRQLSKLRALKKIETANYFSDEKIVNAKRYQIFKSIIFSAKKENFTEIKQVILGFVLGNPSNIYNNFKLLVFLTLKLTGLQK